MVGYVPVGATVGQHLYANPRRTQRAIPTPRRGQMPTRARWSVVSRFLGV